MRKKITIILLFLICIVFVLNALYWFPKTIDDTFISMRYAYNLVHGNGLVWNKGVRVAGFSNFLWTMVNAAVLMVGYYPIFTLKILGILFSIGTLIITYLIAREIIHNTLLALAPSLILVFNPYFCSWATGGMETPLFSFLVVLTYYVFLKEIQQGEAFPYAAFTAVLTALCRIDFFIYLFPLVVFYVLSYGFKLKKYALRFICICLSLYLVYLLWHFIYYGSVLPNTYYAKVTEFPSRTQGIKYVAFFLFPNVSWIFLIGVCLGWMLMFTAIVKRWRDKRIIFFTLPLVMVIFYAIYVNGDWMQNFRFFVPILPFIYVLVAKGVEDTFSFAGKTYIVVPLILLLVLSHLPIDTLRIENFRGKKIYSLRDSLTNFCKPREYIHSRSYFDFLVFYAIENVRPAETIAYSDIGILGYACPDIYILDTVGLTNKEIATIRNENTGNERTIKFNEYLLNNNIPDYLIIKIPTDKNYKNYLKEKDNRYTKLFEIVKVRRKSGEILSTLFLKRKGIKPFSEEDDDYQMIVTERYERAIRLMPGHIELYPRLLDWLDKEQDAEKLKKHLRTFVANAMHHPRKYYYFKTIIPLMLDVGMKNEAKKYLYKFTEWEVEDTWVAHHMASILLRIGDREKARTLIEKSLKADPFYSSTWSLLADIKEREGEIFLAEKYHKTALALATENEKPHVLTSYARFLVRQDKLDEAYNAYTRLQEITEKELGEHDKKILNTLKEKLKNSETR